MNSLKCHIQVQGGISVNSLYYKTAMDGGTPPGHMDARPTTIPPQYTKGELQTPTYLRERVGGVDNTWNIRLGDIVGIPTLPLPPPYLYPPNMHITEILLGKVRGPLTGGRQRVISVLCVRHDLHACLGVRFGAPGSLFIKNRFSTTYFIKTVLRVTS